MKCIAPLAVAAAATLTLVRVAAAEPAGKKPAIGFSNLVLRVDGDPSISIAGDEMRVRILEKLRSLSFNAVGAEDLVFGKDHSARADYLLGGTIRDLKCHESDTLRCRIGIEWQLLDAHLDAVVYRVTTRFLNVGGSTSNPNPIGTALVLGALRSLTTRPGFRSFVSEVPTASTAERPSHPQVPFRTCGPVDLPMPQAAERVLNTTALVRSGEGFGSGFFVSPDGLLVTAAHVVTAKPITVRMRDGAVHEAKIVRSAKNVDAILLRVPNAATAPCLSAALDRKAPVGAEIYAIGAPTSEKLAFSMTRGIVSGLRNIDGTEFLQTDAAVNPGNSGGPLIDQKGRAIAFVSWKITGSSVQGLAFGVPLEVAFRELGLIPGTSTDPGLLNADAALEVAPRVQVRTDPPDSMPVIAPIIRIQTTSESTEAQGQTESVPEEPRPRSYFPLLRWGGVVIGLAGISGVAATAAAYNSTTSTHGEFNDLRLINDIGWATLVAGAGAFVLSYIWKPSTDRAIGPADARLRAPRYSWSMPTGPQPSPLGPGVVLSQ